MTNLKIQELDSKARMYGVKVRFVTNMDAKKIIELRTNLALSRHISTTNPEVDKQIQYINDYKIRERNGLEYYFAFSLIGSEEAVGFYRIYSIDYNEKTFTIGSWIFEHKVLESIPIIADILSKEFGFLILNLERCYFDVRRNNKKVMKYHNLFSPVFIREDEYENNYYYLDKKDFEKNKNDIIKFLI